MRNAIGRLGVEAEIPQSGGVSGGQRLVRRQWGVSSPTSRLRSRLAWGAFVASLGLFWTASAQTQAPSTVAERVLQGSRGDGVVYTAGLVTWTSFREAQFIISSTDGLEPGESVSVFHP